MMVPSTVSFAWSAVIAVRAAASGTEPDSFAKPKSISLAPVFVSMTLDGLYLANCYGEPIFTGNRAADLRKWAESHFRTLLVAVKRSEPRTTLRSRNSE
jgi:hypothetical protein